MIRDKIKVVFWDLDDTLWKGTLAEGDDVCLKQEMVRIVDELNRRGIVNSICSKNDPDAARKKMAELGIWDLFVFPNISFEPKGEMISEALNEMNLRAQNTLFIDDNDSNLREVEFFNQGISVINAADCGEILKDDHLRGKDDSELARLKQYRQLEKKSAFKRKAASNREFLEACHIKLEIIPYGASLFDRIYELSDRTNQLNFTKNRMSKAELEDMLSTAPDSTFACRVADDFGDYGIIGFYTMLDEKLVHFVFSCRIMNMGIEQYVYHMLGCPEIEIKGEVASQIGGASECPDWIELRTASDAYKENDADIRKVLTTESSVGIYGIGACDLYNVISFFNMPNQSVTYDCNYFKGEERALNVGTEYIRSCYDMTEEEKDFCREHFYNYTGEDSFRPRIFSEKYDYIVMSFHDDMAFKIYRNRSNENLRIIRTDDPRIAETNLIDGGSFLSKEEQTGWLQEHFYPGEFISPGRFHDNLMWIADKAPENTRIILITGPELDFYREELPHYREIREQIIKLNAVIRTISKERPESFAVADMNDVVRSRADVTNYIFHLRPDASYSLFKLIAERMTASRNKGHRSMLSRYRGDRDLYIIDDGISAEKISLNLRLGGENDVRIADTTGEGYEGILSPERSYLVLGAKKVNELKIKGFKPLKDYVSYFGQYDNVRYGNVKNENWGDEIEVAVRHKDHLSANPAWKGQTWDGFFRAASDRKVLLFASGAGMTFYIDKYRERARLDLVADNDANKAGRDIASLLVSKSADIDQLKQLDIIKEKKIMTPVETLKCSDPADTVVLIANIRYYDKIHSQLLSYGYTMIYSLLQMEVRERGLTDA